MYLRTQKKSGNPVTVTYKDGSGTKVAEPKVVNGKIGDPYDVTTANYKIAVTNYTLDSAKLPANGKGTFTNADQEVKYVYNKNAGANVTVKYLDSTGKDIATAKVIKGVLGASYDATTSEYKLTIDKFTLDENKLPSNGKGTFTATAQTVTYTYNAVVEE